MRSEDPHDGGLAADLESLARRRSLRWIAGAALGAPAIAALAQPRRPGGGGGGGSSGGGTGNASCPLIAEETAGPYPGDGSNANASGLANALLLSGIVRSDIRPSLTGTSTAAGVPMTLRLTLVNTSSSCAALAGYAIYAWHCDREGRYSMYSSGVTGDTFLRGVQVTDASGAATFISIFPGCYSGRMPHVHFEVYRSLATATQYTNKLRTSQLAFPIEPCQAVYSNVAGYEASLVNFGRISFATDGVFSDGTSTEMATVTGSTSAGYQVSLSVPISA